jgi:hypothetical protein
MLAESVTLILPNLPTRPEIKIQTRIVLHVEGAMHVPVVHAPGPGRIILHGHRGAGVDAGETTKADEEIVATFGSRAVLDETRSAAHDQMPCRTRITYDGQFAPGEVDHRAAAESGHGTAGYQPL